MANIVLKPGASPSTNIILGDPTALTVALLAGTVTRGGSRTAFMGTLPLPAAGKSLTSTAAQFSGAANLKSAASSRAGSRTLAVRIASLAAAVGAMATARAATLGRAALKAAGSARTASTAAMSVVVFGQLLLAALSRAGSAGRAAISGRAVLTTRGYGRGRAKQTALSGVLTLTTASSARGTGNAKPFLIAPLTAVSAFGRSIANSLALLFLKRPVLLDPDYVVQYPSPIRSAQYPLPTRAAQYPE